MLHENERDAEAYSDIIIRGLPNSIELYNNQRIQAIRSHLQRQGTITNDMEKADSQGFDSMRSLEKTRGNKSSKYAPTLERLWHNLEMANSHPNNALQYLK